MLASLSRRKRNLRILGIAALLPSAVSAIFFIFYSISASKHGSTLASSCIISAILEFLSFGMILLFTVRPSTSANLRFRVYGAVPSLLSSIMGAVSLVWMNVRRWRDLPQSIMGRSSSAMIIAGFGVLVVTITFSTIFWTVLVLAGSSSFVPTSPIEAPQSPMRQVHSRKPSKSILPDIRVPSPTFSPEFYQAPPTGSSIRDKKRSSLRTTIPKSSKDSKRKSSQFSTFHPNFSLPLCPGPAVLEHDVPNHFDAWDTSDTLVCERMVAELAEVEREEAAAGLGLEVITSGVGKPVIGSPLAVSTPLSPQSRPLSPQLPVTPKSFAFDIALKRARESRDMPVGATAKWIAARIEWEEQEALRRGSA